jgi:hypothetical protein
MKKDELILIKIGDDDNPSTLKDIQNVQSIMTMSKALPQKTGLKILREKIEMEQPGFLVLAVGNKNRPPTQRDIDDIYQVLEKRWKDPSLLIITHHAVEAVWIKTNLRGKKSFISKVPYVVISGDI